MKVGSNEHSAHRQQGGIYYQTHSSGSSPLGPTLSSWDEDLKCWPQLGAGVGGRARALLRRVPAARPLAP